MRGILSTKAVWPSEDEGKKSDGSQLVLAATFGIPALVVVGLLLLLISYQGGIETAVANLALLLPVGFAFAAGMVASVNPCGIMMLSSFTFYQVRNDGSSASAVQRVLRSLVNAVVVTLGFVVVFAAAGAIIAAGGQWLIRSFPYAGLALGAAMVGLGGWLLAARKTLGFVPGKQASLDPQRGLRNAFLFGLVYAVASLSCTLPIFLGVVGATLVSDGLLASVGQFISYAIGMGVIILVVTIGAAVARRAMARWLRTLTPYVHRLSAMFLVGAGVYLIYYWLFVGGLAL